MLGMCLSGSNCDKTVHTCYPDNGMQRSPVAFFIVEVVVTAYIEVGFSAGILVELVT